MNVERNAIEDDVPVPFRPEGLLQVLHGKDNRALPNSPETCGDLGTLAMVIGKFERGQHRSGLQRAGAGVPCHRRFQSAEIPEERS